MSAGGTVNLHLGLRCASGAFVFDLAATVINDGGPISGNWSETTRNVNGTIQGRSENNGRQVQSVIQKANRVVRSESKLESAALSGEPAHQRRSLYPCKRESRDAEGLGDKAVMGGSGVVGDGRLWRDRTREARRPAWCKKEKGSQGTALRKERYRPRGRASTQESEHSW
jgi:hypothetical protein